MQDGCGGFYRADNLPCEIVIFRVEEDLVRETCKGDSPQCPDDPVAPIHEDTESLGSSLCDGTPDDLLPDHPAILPQSFRKTEPGPDGYPPFG